MASATVKLFAGEADFFSPLTVESLGEVARTPSITVRMYPSFRYQHLAFNLRNPANARAPHPVLGDVAVRRALSMAADRARIVASVFDTIGRVAVGPLPRVYVPDVPAIGTPAFDLPAARALLDSAGWTAATEGGVRSRGGVPLRVEILVPSVSANRDRMAVLLQDQLRAVGADITIQRLEVNALVSRLESGRFDAFMGGWITSPGLVGLRQVWGARAYGGEGSNYGGYGNASFDANVDSVLSTFDTTLHRRALTRALQTIVADAPAIWIVEDDQPAGMSTRIEPGALPKSGWWNGLADWRIPPARRIDRDRIGLAPAN